MTEQIIIQDLEFHSHCGVTEEERMVPQPLGVDLFLHYPPLTTWHLADQDHLSQGMDYALVVERVVAIGTQQSYQLLETMAERMIADLFEKFPAVKIQLHVKKLRPPVKPIQRSVGIQLTRTRLEQHRLPLSPFHPSDFLIEYLDLLPRGRVLDLACGEGRNALYLAQQGYQVTGLDRNKAALDVLMGTAHAHHLHNVTVQQIDLECDPCHPPDFSKELYDLVIVFFYLYRPGIPNLLRAIKPGGVLLYETFLIDNHIQHHHPRNKEFCLQHNELLQLTSGMRILHYHEGKQPGEHQSPSAVTARLLAQKESPGVQT